MAGTGATEAAILERGGPSPGHGAGLLVVVNAHASGTERVRAMLDELRRAARGAGVSATEVVTGTDADLRGALDTAGPRRVVLVGGDGSVQAAVNATRSMPELALLPAGRANNIARGLGIPQDPAGAVAVALGAPCRALDLLRVQRGARILRCVEGLSAGFQAQARSAYDGENSADLVAGVRAFAGALRAYHPAYEQLEIDGHVAFEGDVAQIFLSNLPFFGFGFRVDPLADPADGRFEAIVVTARSRRELGRRLLEARSGAHVDRPGVRVLRGRRATVRGTWPLAGDGTPLGLGDASVVVEPGALHLAAPERP